MELDLDRVQFGSRRLEEIATTSGTPLESLTPAHSEPDSLRAASTFGRSAVIVLPETNPGEKWKLPKIDPTKVYSDLSIFYKLGTSVITVKKKSIPTYVNGTKIFSLPFFSQSRIQKELKNGHDFIHIGKVIIGIVPLHRRGLPVYFSGCMLDKRCEEFTSAVIGGCQGSLAYGPRVFEVFPDLPVRLADPAVHEALTLGLQTKGYECFHSQSHNLAIHYSYCVRFYKTHIPPTLQVPTKTSGVVTLHDEELDQ